MRNIENVFEDEKGFVENIRRNDDLNVVLPRSKTKYYDAGHKMIEPLSTKDLLDMLELSQAKAQDNQ